MSKEFELFCKIYSVLDAFNDLHRVSFSHLDAYLSEANPHVWGGESSGDPAVYAEFKGIIGSLDLDKLTVYEIAKIYFSKIDDYYVDAKKAFSAMSENEFISLLDISSH